MDSSKTTSLDPFVQIDSEELKGDTQVISKVKMILNVNERVFVFRILILEMPENLDFYDALFLETFLVPDELHGHVDAFLMIKTLYDLSKGPFSQEREYFVAVTNVIMFCEKVVSAGIIKAWRMRTRRAP